jgi:hypothetical protein
MPQVYINVISFSLPLLFRRVSMQSTFQAKVALADRRQETFGTGSFAAVRRNIPVFVKVVHQYRALYMKTCLRF